MMSRLFLAQIETIESEHVARSRLSKRKLIDSPFTVGMVETRTSMFWSWLAN